MILPIDHPALHWPLPADYFEELRFALIDIVLEKTAKFNIVPRSFMFCLFFYTCYFVRSDGKGGVIFNDLRLIWTKSLNGVPSW